jgi:hypothetical protein
MVPHIQDRGEDDPRQEDLKQPQQCYAGNHNVDGDF